VLTSGTGLVSGMVFRFHIHFGLLWQCRDHGGIGGLLLHREYPNDAQYRSGGVGFGSIYTPWSLAAV
jgi:hypothetical protein